MAFATATQELFGVAAHERVVIESPTAQFDATKLEVIAIASPWQGRRFSTGERPSDVPSEAADAT